MIFHDNEEGQRSLSEHYYIKLQAKDTSLLQRIVHSLTKPMLLVIFFSIIFVVLVFIVSHKTKSNFISLIHQPSNQIAQYDLVFLNTTTALCLDGSPAAYQISKNGDPNKIYLHFQGGGWCQKRISNNKKVYYSFFQTYKHQFKGTNTLETLEDCYKRSKTQKGSSRFYPQSNLTHYNSGIFSSQSRNNFKDWKRVKLLYCDGSGHQGTKYQPVQYKDSLLYFRGYNITVQTFNDLQKKIGLFSKAHEVIIGGDSAGGLAAFQWANYISKKIKRGNVHVIPDSGIFYDSYQIETQSPLLRLQYKSLMQIVNKQIDPPVPECIKNHPLEKQKCMFAQNIISEIKVPIFVIQALYDDWSVVNILGIKCINGLSLKNCNIGQRMIIEENRRNVLKVIDEIIKNPKNGAWIVACSRHTYTTTSVYYNQNFRIPSGSQNSVSFAIQNWLKNSTSSHFYIDKQKCPNNNKCSGKNYFL